MNKVSVSVRAVEARVKRALAKDGESLRKCREDSRWHNNLGDYYIVDAGCNSITAQHVDLEKLARELNLLKPYEVIAE